MSWRHIGGGEAQLHSFLTSALDGDEWYLTAHTLVAVQTTQLQLVINSIQLR